MKIALIDAGPRLLIRKNDSSLSHMMLQDIRRMVRRNRSHEMEEFHFRTGKLTEEQIRELMTCDAWVIAYPVFSGGLPAHMLSFMHQIEEKGTNHKEIQVYAIGHTGLFEGSEVFPSLHMLTHWCEHCHMSWGGGLGVGAAPTHLDQGILSLTHSRKRAYFRRMTGLAEAVSGGVPILNATCTADISKKTYLIWHNRFIKRLARNNGVKTMDIQEQI